MIKATISSSNNNNKNSHTDKKESKKHQGNLKFHVSLPPT
jgi:hypothetical protein